MTIKLTQNQIDYLHKRKIFICNTTSKGKTYLKPGDNFHIPDDLKAEPYSRLRTGRQLPTMGSFSYTRSALIASWYKMGRYCSIADNVRIFGANHPMERFSTSTFTYLDRIENKAAAKEFGKGFEFAFRPSTYIQPIILQNDVWIGSHVALRPGITIGNGAVIATGAVVTKDVPPYAVVGGNPARILKYRFSEDIIEKLLAIEWWQYCYADFKGIAGNIDILSFIDYIENQSAKGILKPYNPKPMTAEQLKMNN